MTKPNDADRDFDGSRCSASCVHPFYCTAFATTPQEPKMGLSNQEIERKLYEASKYITETLEECFPTTPEGVAALEKQFANEGPIELPESLRDASKVLDRIIKREKRRCPKCGKVGQMFTADLDWCPACKHQWPGA